MNNVVGKTSASLGLPHFIPVWNELAHLNSYEFVSVVVWLVQAQLQAPVVNIYC